MGASTRTITIDKFMVWGAERVNIIKISCTDYGTDGILVSARDCGLTNLDYLIPFYVGDGVIAGNAAPVSAWWDSTGGVLLLFKSSEAGIGAVNVTSAGYIYALAIGS